MNSQGWQAVALKDILALSREPVKVDLAASYPNLGIFSFGRGVFRKPPIAGSVTSAAALYRVRAGQVIYSRLFAFEGAFATVPAEMDGWFVSNEYPTFDVQADLALPEFIGLVLTQPAVWRELASMTVGMGHRRQRLQPDALLEFEVEIPPLTEQRAIVAAVQAADALCAATVAESNAIGQLYRALRESLFEAASGDDVQVGEIVSEIEGGRSPRCLDRAPSLSEWGVVKLSAIRPGLFREGEAKALPDGIQPFAKAEIRSGDIIITRSNTRDRVGTVCRVGGVRPQLLLCDLTWRLHADETRIEPDFLVEALTTVDARSQIESAATGTSDSMRKISRKVLRGIQLSLPSLADQQRITAALAAIRLTRDEAARELDRLTTLRSSLASSLVLGESRVSETLAA